MKNALIFCNRKRDVDIVAKSLKRHGFSAAGLHGDMAQAVRTETLQSFKAGNITYLVATDVAGRGLDIIGMSHVFNFDVPFHAEDYIHRIGRTGRAGAKGRAITLATRADGKYLAAIEKLIGKKIPTLDGMATRAPSVEAQAEAQTENAVAGNKQPSRSRRKPRRGGQKNTRAAENTKATAVSKSADAAKPARAGNTEPAPRKTAEPARGRRRQKSNVERKPIIGLGDHMPAFLARDPKKTG